MAKQIDDIISFDPAESYEFSNNEVDGNVYRRLVAPDHADTTKVIGDAAESWTVSPDGKIFTFKLKPDVMFPSGKAATAEDAAFSLQRVVKLNKTPGFIITQFGFTKDNVDTPDQGDRRRRPCISSCRRRSPPASCCSACRPMSAPSSRRPRCMANEAERRHRQRLDEDPQRRRRAAIS